MYFIELPLGITLSFELNPGFIYNEPFILSVVS